MLGEGVGNRAITTLGKSEAEVDAVSVVFTWKGARVRLRLLPPSLWLNANESDLHLIPTDLRFSLGPVAGLFKDAAVRRTRL